MAAGACHRHSRPGTPATSASLGYTSKYNCRGYNSGESLFLKTSTTVIIASNGKGVTHAFAGKLLTDIQVVFIKQPGFIHVNKHY